VGAPWFVSFVGVRPQKKQTMVHPRAVTLLLHIASYQAAGTTTVVAVSLTP